MVQDLPIADLPTPHPPQEQLEQEKKPERKGIFREYANYFVWWILILLAPFTILFYFSQNALPGDKLYAVKRGMEDVVLTLASLNPSTKAVFQSGLADKRFSEAEKLLLARSDTAGLGDLVDEVNQTQKEIDTLTNTADKTKLQAQLDEKITTYQDKLRQTAQEIAVQIPSSNTSNNSTGSTQSNSQNSGSSQTHQIVNQTTVVQYVYIINPTTGQQQQVTPTPAVYPTTAPVIAAAASHPTPNPSRPGPTGSVQPTPTSPTAVSPTPVPTGVGGDIDKTIDELEKIRRQHHNNQASPHLEEDHPAQNQQDQVKQQSAPNPTQKEHSGENNH